MIFKEKTRKSCLDIVETAVCFSYLLKNSLQNYILFQRCFFLTERVSFAAIYSKLTGFESV